MTCRPTSARQAGVTLLELAIVFSIVSILAVMTLPLAMDRLQRDTVIVHAERLASAISLAQATAQHRHVRAEISAKGRRHDWRDGWQLTISPWGEAANKSPSSSSEILLSVALPTFPRVELAHLGRKEALSYGPMGYSQLEGTRLSISSGRHVLVVVISPAGRARICDPATDSNRCGITGDGDPDSDP